MNTEALVVVRAGICHWLSWDRFLSEKKQTKQCEYQDMKLLICVQPVKQSYTVLTYFLTYLLTYLHT